MSVSAFRLRRTALVVLAATLGACTTWNRHPVALPGHDRFFVGPVRVIRSDGSMALLDNVTLGRDSIVGRESAGTRARVAIPVSEVRSVEARHGDVLGTLVVAALGTAAAFAVYAAAVIAIVGTGN